MLRRIKGSLYGLYLDLLQGLEQAENIAFRIFQIREPSDAWNLDLIDCGSTAGRFQGMRSMARGMNYWGAVRETRSNLGDPS